MDCDETYILLLLSDSNLPTGSFVASSGFESYIKHGFGSRIGDGNRANGTDRMTAFMRDSISAYSRNALPFVSDAHRITVGAKLEEKLQLQKLQELDELYDVMTLNHVAKRTSKSQGVSLLTLYSKGFSYSPPSVESASLDEEKGAGISKKMASLIARYKTLVRAERAPGHLPICWGILTGALGLSLERSQYLHIFLHARSLLSASIRLNELGPYNAQQILLHIAKQLIEAEVERCRDLRTGIDVNGEGSEKCEEFDEVFDGPANTWPLGEILAARHDQQHSRIFNS